MADANRKKMIRNIIAVLGGLLLASIVAAGIEALGHSIWPPPEMDQSEGALAATVQAAAWMKIAPTGAMLMVALAHCIGVACGVGFAFKIQRDFKMAGVVVGAFFLLFALLMFMWITHPFWFIIADLLAIIVGIVIPWRMLKS
jgi:hypothetical protein